MKRWVLILVILALAAGSFFIGRWTKPVKTVEVPGPERIVEKIVEVPAECEVCPECPEPVVQAPVEQKPQTEEKEAGIVELGLYQEITQNYSNPSSNPSVQVGPGEAVFGTADPGSLRVGEVDKDSEGLGFVFAVYNKSGTSIDVSFTTSYNGNPTTGNDHWNISPVLVKVNDFQVLTERVNTLQKADAKPKVLYFIWDGTDLIPQN